MASSARALARTAPLAAKPSASLRGGRGPVPCRAAPKLYTNPRSRGKIVEWYAKEIGCDLECVSIDMEAKEHKSPEFVAINPFGKLPAMEVDGLSFMESGTLLTYLAQKYGGHETPESCAEVGQWVMYANSSLAQCMAAMMNGKQEQLDATCTVLEGILSAQPYLTGDAFTVADVAVGAYLLYFPMFLPDFDFAPYPAIQKYMEGLSARPAYKEAYGTPP